MSVVSEIAEYLEDQGIGTVGENIFYSVLPDDIDQDFELAVIDRPGQAPSPYIKDIHRPQFQILLRAKDYDTGKSVVDQIREALHMTVNQYLIPGGIYFRKILAIQEVGHLGLNDAGRDEFSINFMCEVIE